MKEIQKTARTVHRILIAVCSVMIAGALSPEEPEIPQATLNDLDALIRINLDEYAHHLEQILIQSEPGSTTSIPAEYIGRILKNSLPHEIEVYVPDNVIGIDWRSLTNVRSNGTVEELYNYLRTNDGARRLPLSGARLLPEELHLQISGALAEAPAGMFEVRYEVSAGLQSTAVGESRLWPIRGAVCSKPKGAPPAATLRSTIATVADDAEPTIYIPGTRVWEWIEENQGELWPRLKLPQQLLPGLAEAWSQIKDKTPREAKHILEREVHSRTATVTLLGVSLPRTQLMIAGPALCFFLLLILASNLKLISKSPDEKELEWAPLWASGPAILARRLTVLTMTALPLGAHGFLIYQYRPNLVVAAALFTMVSVAAFHATKSLPE